MDINEAFQLILDLASDNLVSEYDNEEERERQLEALNIVTEFAMGHGVTFIE